MLASVTPTVHLGEAAVWLSAASEWWHLTTPVPTVAAFVGVKLVTVCARLGAKIKTLPNNC